MWDYDTLNNNKDLLAQAMADQLGIPVGDINVLVEQAPDGTVTVRYTINGDYSSVINGGTFGNDLNTRFTNDPTLAGAMNLGGGTHKRILTLLFFKNVFDTNFSCCMRTF